MLTKIKSLNSLGLCISAPILPYFHLFRGRITPGLASSPSITPAHSSRCRGESVLSAFQLLCQIPPGARRIPVIASSKLRYACTLTHMKERERERVKERCKSAREGASIWLRETESVRSCFGCSLRICLIKKVFGSKLQITAKSKSCLICSPFSHWKAKRGI